MHAHSVLEKQKTVEELSHNKPVSVLIVLYNLLGQIM